MKRYRVMLVVVILMVLLVGCNGPEPTVSPIAAPGGQAIAAASGGQVIAAAQAQNQELPRGVAMDFAIGGIAVAVLIVGIVEAAKEFGLQGVGCRALAMALGIFFVGLAHGINEGLIPAVAVPYIVWVVTAIAGGLAAMGYYDFAKRIFITSKYQR